MLGDEMIDEASRKMALVIAAKGRAAGMTRTSQLHAAGPTRRQPRPRQLDVRRAIGVGGRRLIQAMPTTTMMRRCATSANSEPVAIQPTMMPASAMPSPPSPRSPDLPPGDVAEDRADRRRCIRRARSAQSPSTPTIETTSEAIASPLVGGLTGGAG